MWKQQSIGYDLCNIQDKDGCYSENKVLKFSACCGNGKIDLPLLQDPPQYIMDLLTGGNPNAQLFRNHIRTYNSALSFASLIAEGLDHELANAQNGIYTFRVNGDIYHKLNTNMKQQPAAQFGHIYYLQDVNQALIRLERAPYLDLSTLHELGLILQDLNPYAKVFSQYNQTCHATTVSVQLITTGVDKRVYNAPSVDEIAVFVPDGFENNPDRRAIVLKKSKTADTRFHTISPLQSCYDPLHYVLLFFRGEQGWHPGLKNSKGGKISQMDFYSWRVQTRGNSQNHIVRSGRLFHQYLVDAWVSTESSRLKWVADNQTTLKFDAYKDIRKTIMDGGNTCRIGISRVLPASFKGSKRHFINLYQDAMATVRKFGKPDLFITVTCNANWPEIRENLYPNQVPSDRPDLCCTVFNLKLQAITNDILKKGLFGETVAHVYVIEFQKRGLPHAHILIILKTTDKIRTVEKIDEFVSAEIPDKNIDVDLYNIVSRTMIHECAQNRCLEYGICAKGFPKEFCKTTALCKDGFPEYRRRNNGNTVQKKDKIFDNRHIVPYSPKLSKKYECHINVEICTSIVAVKYIYKYIFKGHDRALLNFVTTRSTIDGAKLVDEIHEYKAGRYVCATEAFWHLQSYKMHKESHNVIKLAIHEENYQSIGFDSTSQMEIAHLPQLELSAQTTLTAFFKLNMVFFIVINNYSQIVKQDSYYIKLYQNIIRGIKKKRFGKLTEEVAKE